MKWLRLLVGALVIVAVPLLLDVWTGARHEQGLREVAIPQTVVVEELPVLDPRDHVAPDSVSRYVALGIGAGAVAVLTRQVGA